MKLKDIGVAVLVLGIVGILVWSQSPSTVVEQPIESYTGSFDGNSDQWVEYVDDTVTAKEVELNDVELTEDIVDGSSDLTFGGAFREARMLMGSGETFFYRGFEYTTNYAEEEIVIKADSADVASDHILEQLP
tara:strand:+ start:298 stop:696 length:399 start_codon:yes stop_codon:yes gene_type:complete